jgi:predicted nucleic acid-binding protein
LNERWIANASPLILLGKVGLLDVLTGLCPDLLVPEGVSQELRLGPSTDPA